MRHFWHDFILPLARGCEAKLVCEIGSEFGGLTRNLLGYCEQAGAVAHVIEPRPRYDVDEWRQRYGETFVFHRGLSLEVLGGVPVPDLALIDGDHNWYTVLGELRLLERRAVEEARPLPVMVMHDVGWPYARRDLYYDPETVPEDQRQPFRRQGISLEGDGLVGDGYNAHLCNGLRAGGARSGVLTAVEDFMAESETEWFFKTVPGFHGLGALVAEERLAGEPELARGLARWDDPEVLRAHIEALEESRVASEAQSVRDRRAAARARAEAAAARSERDAWAATADGSISGSSNGAGGTDLRALRRDLECVAASRTWRLGQSLSARARTLAGAASVEDPLAAVIARLDTLERSGEPTVCASDREGAAAV